MLLVDGHAELFWFVARPCAMGKQLAAVSDIRTGSPFVDSSAAVRVVPFSAVEHFLTVRTFSDVCNGRLLQCSCIHCEELLPQRGGN